MTTGRTRLSPDLRREQILQAASAAFRGADYSAVGLDAIADAAGVTRGLLHHYFGSKRGLYLAVVERAARIPPSTVLVPPDATGDLHTVLDLSVRRWMSLISEVGGLWSGVDASGGIAHGDVDEIIVRARDELVERMIDELPFPPALDRDLLRSALRAYAGFARVATEEWLLRRTLGREETHAMLTAALIALVDSAVPAMEGVRVTA
jgi:AcrR family transcriptional regulator